MLSRKPQSSLNGDSGAARDASASAGGATSQPGLEPALGTSLLDASDKPAMHAPPRHWFSGRLRGYLFAVFGKLAISPDAVMLRFIRKHSIDAVRCEDGVSKELCNVHVLMVLLCFKYAMLGGIQLVFVL
jgi:hypothetical protein